MRMVMNSPPSAPQPTWPVPLDLMRAQQMGGVLQWTGVGGLGQMGAVSFPVGVRAGQMG